MDRKYIFLAKIKNTDDRDCVYYYDTTSFSFECGHYFTGLRTSGASFGGFENELREVINNNFDDIESILTKEEFLELFKLHDEIKALKYGIKIDTDKYNTGLELCNKAKDLLKKLYDKENLELFNKVISDEKKVG